MDRAKSDEASDGVLSDTSRAREAFKYIELRRSIVRATVVPSRDATNSKVAAGDHSPSPPEHVPRGCDDTALAAFAQLATLRLSAKRCLISLLGIDSEYILAESTPSLSLQSDLEHSAKDALWLGTCTLPRAEGFTDIAIKTWTQTRGRREAPVEEDHYFTDGHSEHWIIVSDVRNHDELSSHPFIQSAPGLRSLAAVPIRTPSGTVIGSYTILDDKPRYGLSTGEMVFLEDMADTIMGHLEMRRVVAQGQRGARLIKGLALFNEGKDSLRDWWLANHSQRKRGDGQRRRDQHLDDAKSRGDRADEELGMTYKASELDSKGRTLQGPKSDAAEHKSPSQASSSTIRETDNPRASSNMDSQSAHLPHHRTSRFDLKDETADVFARASNLIREGSNVDGVLFVDASVSNSHDQARFNKSKDHLDPTTESEGSEDAPQSDDASRTAQKDTDNDTTCPLLGFSTKVRSSIRGFSPSSKHTTLSRRFVARLIRQYPRGKIFTYRDDGHSWSSSGTETLSSEPTSSGTSVLGVLGAAKLGVKGSRTAVAVADVFPETRSLAFFPMWDARRERWRGAMFVYTALGSRTLDSEEDLTYIAAFSNSIQAHLARLDAMQADQVKATFIASVSHELRSPLHGVLAGVEFLEETQLSIQQQQMADTISVAGNTLLDTINHVLDFTKINSFDDVERQERRDSDISRNSAFKAGDMGEIGVTAIVDLAVLTENVADTVVRAHWFQAFGRERSGRSDGKRYQSSSNLAGAKKQRVDVHLDISKHISWKISLSPGSWTRIITNLLGNALKYTKSGSILLRLDAKPCKGKDKGRTRIQLLVEDTGQGISAEYLQNNLYMPFSQENSHAVGTGLGLSIVKQIVGDIGGHIDIQSEVGRGTKIMVDFTTQTLAAREEPGRGGGLAQQPGQHIRLAIVGSQMEHGDGKADSQVQEQQDDRTRSIVSKTCSRWLGYSCRPVRTPREASPDDICIILESDYQRWLTQQRGARDRRQEEGSLNSHPPLIVLTAQAGNAGKTIDDQDDDGVAVFMMQPFGPRKLASTVNAILKQAEAEVPANRRRAKDAAIPTRLARDVSTNNDESHGDASDVAESRRAQETGRSKGDIILLVEDNEINMKLLLASVEKLGRSYATAENGLEAVNVYAKDPTAFGLILMDMSMPIMDGFAAAENIRNLESKDRLKRCRIVALTGAASEEARKQAFDSGVDEFVVKPASMRKLKALIEGTG